MNIVSEVPGSTQIRNSESPNGKIYDLEPRTLQFATRVIQYVNKLPKTISNNEVARQLVRASGSVGANYIEANESLGKKDFLMHIRICRKESKEARYWLLLTSPKPEEETGQRFLTQEATELMKIFGAILQKSL